MGVERPAMDEVDEVADRWVALARDQRRHESHLEAESNRSAVRESVAQHVVTDGLLVSRAGDDAADPERIVGFVMFGPERGDYDLDVRRGVVENLYVEPAFRGEGRGTALLEAAERRLFEAGFDRICLEVLAENEAARRFYDRHGYSPHRLELEKAPENDTHSKGE